MLVKFPKKSSNAGFSLVEVAMALAIMGFASVSLIGMIPLGMTSFHQAMSNTIESQIVQSLSNDILLANTSDLSNYVSGTAFTPSPSHPFYFDAEGSMLTSSTGAVYTAEVTQQSITGSNSPAALINTSAYNLTIWVAGVSLSNPNISSANPYSNPLLHPYPLIIANNNQ